MIRSWARCLGIVLVLATSAADARGPQRIVSMNLCTDQMALLLTGPERIVSISFLGADPAESSLAHLADGIDVNHGLAEEVIAAQPDLVLAGRYTTSFAKAMLRRLGYKVVEVDSPTTIAEIHDTFRRVGDVLGEPERAAALLADMDKRLEGVSARARDRTPQTAIIYDANGFTVGRPGLADDIMTRVGLINMAPELGIGSYGQVPLESMLAVRPGNIVQLSYRPDAPSISNLSMQHPALKLMLEGNEPLSVPGRLFTCGTPIVAEAAEAMMTALEASE